MDASMASTVGEPAARLILSWRGRESSVSACSRLDEPSGFSIGTHADNDLPLHSTYSSRSHAQLCWRRNGFTLTDHSTNGVYLQLEDEQVRYLHRDSIRLWGSGYISFGEPPTPANVLRFQHA